MIRSVDATPSAALRCAGYRSAMTMLAVALLTTVAVSFHLRRATPILPLAIDRPASSRPRSPAEKAPNPPRQQTANAEIPIASDARPLHTSRGFLPWRFAYAGPRCTPRHRHGAGIRKPSQKRPWPEGWWHSRSTPSFGNSPYVPALTLRAKARSRCAPARCAGARAERPVAGREDSDSGVARSTRSTQCIVGVQRMIKNSKDHLAGRHPDAASHIDPAITQ